MTVKELMTKLSTCNPDTRVMVYCRGAEESDYADSVTETTLDDPLWHPYVRDDDRGTSVPIVILCNSPMACNPDDDRGTRHERVIGPIVIFCNFL